MNKKYLKIILGTSLSLISIPLINKLIFYKAVLKNKLFEQHKYYYNWRYGKIFYSVQGSGKPILLIHDANSGSCSYIWKENIDYLSKYYKVYTIDLLGFGRSHKPKITYTAYLYVQLISDFIENVIKEPTNIISTSLSSAFVTMCCYQNKEIFDKLMFINPPDLTDLSKYPSKISNINRKILESPLLGTAIYNLITSKYNRKRFLQNKCFYNSKKVSKKLVNIFNESAHLGGSSAKYATASFLTKYMNINIKNALSSIDNSIYIVLNKDDSSKTQSIINQYLKINSSIEYSTLEKTKLFLNLEQKNEFNNICRIFFD